MPNVRNTTKQFSKVISNLPTHKDKTMIINLKAILLDYHPTLFNNVSKCCVLSVHDPEFNKGHGELFYGAVERAIRRGDFRHDNI